MNIKTDKICLFTVKASCEKIQFCGHSIFDLIKTEEEALPLLWCRDGEFRLVPREVIMNAVDLSKLFKQTEMQCVPPMLFLTWSQGIEISNQAGRALVGE